DPQGGPRSQAAGLPVPADAAPDRAGRREQGLDRADRAHPGAQRHRPGLRRRNRWVRRRRPGQRVRRARQRPPARGRRGPGGAGPLVPTVPRTARRWAPTGVGMVHAVSAWQALAVLAAGLGAGMINAVVGSGTLLTFPTLLALGYPAVTANVSNNIGLVFGGV